MDYIFRLGVFQALILTVIIWIKYPINRKAVVYIALLLILSSCILIAQSDIRLLFIQPYVHFISLPDALLFTYGPITYLFTRTILKTQTITRKSKWLHFTPALFNLFVLNAFISLNISGQYDFLTRDMILGLYKVIELLGIISCTTYLLLSIRTYDQYRIRFLQEHTSHILPSTLRKLFITGLILTGFWFLSFVLRNFNIIPNHYLFYNLFWTMICTSIYLLCYYLLGHPEVFKMPVVHPNPSKAQASSPLLSDHMISTYVKVLNDHIKDKKPYLIPTLSILELSEQTGIKKHELSALLNQKYKLNFFDYINQLRVKEFITLYERNKLQDQGTTFVEIAYQVGFNSKSAFNRAFKKEMKTSPSRYFSTRIIQV